MMTCKITLYTPGGLFLDEYVDVDYATTSFPGTEDAKLPYLRFYDPKTGQRVRTSLPWLAIMTGEK